MLAAAQPADLDRGGLLITGATGFVGMAVLARYLERTDRPLYALIRSEDESGAATRMRSVLASLFGREDAYEGRVVAVPADIEREGLGMTVSERRRLAERVTDIVHAAASVSFSLSLGEARAINVEGTRRVLELAVLCQALGGLRRLSYVSTAYVAGTHAGSFREDQLEVGQGFRNSYERSKFEAEQVVRAYAGRLPVQIVRPSIVVGKRGSGWTTSFNVLYSPLKAFARGALPALPARRSAPVDVVPVDYVADAIFELSSRDQPADGVYHLVAGPQATTVGGLIDLAARHFNRRRPLPLPPPLYRRIVHPWLARQGGERRRRALRRSEVFFPYLAMRVAYDDRRARAALAPTGVRPTPVEGYFPRLVEFAERADWGRRALGRAEAHTDPKRPPAATSSPGSSPAPTG